MAMNKTDHKLLLSALGVLLALGVTPAIALTATLAFILGHYLK